MSKQRQVLLQMVDELSDRYPGCGVLVSGSVKRRQERPDSDIDLFVVFEGTGNLGLTNEPPHDGIKIDLALFPEDTFQSEVRKNWYNFWMFSQAEIVSDPLGIAKANQAIALSHFERHPRVLAAWINQQSEVEKHKADRTHKLEFPNWVDFSSHVKELIAEP